jgi:hypothetical protein
MLVALAGRVNRPSHLKSRHQAQRAQGLTVGHGNACDCQGVTVGFLAVSRRRLLGRVTAKFVVAID